MTTRAASPCMFRALARSRLAGWRLRLALLGLPWLIAWMIAGSAVAVDVVPPAPGACGDVLTWEIRGAPAAWSDADVTKTPCLVVIGPDHKTWRRPAFAYRAYRGHPPSADTPAVEPPVEFDPVGEAILQARHTARIAGTHAWTLLAPDGSTVAHGEILIAAGAGKQGPLRICRDNKRLLSFADGTVFIPIGPNIAWANGPDRLARFDAYFKALKAAGGNHCRVWMSSWCGQIEGPQQDAWRLDHAWLFDEILRLARASGLRVTVVLDNYYDLVNGHMCPYGQSAEERVKTFISADPPAAYQRRLRYVLARWGADDSILAWELFNELDMAQPVREKCIPWAKAASAMLRRIDTDGRLRTLSWCGDDFDRVMGLPDIDLTQVHGYVLEWADPGGTKKPATRDGVRMFLEFAENAASLGKPFCISEVGYQEGQDHDNPGNERDKEGLLLRQQAWAGLMLGGYGSGMNWWWDTYIDAGTLWPQYRGLAATVARVDWQDRDLAPLTPNSVGDKALVMGWLSPSQALIWPQPRADTWHAHIVDGKARATLPAPIRIGLAGFKPSTPFTLHYLDMVGGGERQRGETVSGADGTLTILVPPLVLDQVVWAEIKK